MKKAYLFPGQGSQKKEMGADHYHYQNSFKERCEQANEILGYRITDIMFDGPEETLLQTRYTQPALFVHSYSLFELLGHRVDMVAGHSLGEFTALAAAGVLGFEDALRAVSRRGELMQNAGNKQPGTMAAVIGLDDAAVEQVCGNVSEETEQTVLPANYNADGQLVISGHTEAVEKAMEELRQAGAKIVKKLPVSGAFHSSLMETARDELDEILDTLVFNPAKAFVYSNATGEGSDSPEVLKENLKKQLLQPVLWTQTLRNMHNNGACHFIEVGPGNVLQGLVKRTLKKVEISGFQ